jgi:pSer/pThr/pTyr-binding forkhead associated (FHA) protein
VLHTSGATGTRLNGENIHAPRQLKEGDKIEIGTAELTFRRSKLPLGVSIVDRSEGPPLDDVLTRRTTIANPILGSHDPGERRSAAPLLLLFVVCLESRRTTSSTGKSLQHSRLESFLELSVRQSLQHIGGKGVSEKLTRY